MPLCSVTLTGKLPVDGTLSTRLNPLGVIASTEMSLLPALAAISKAVLSGETAACWIRFTPDGQFAFAINAGSGSISTFRLEPDGELSLVSAVTVDTGGPFSLPIDADITADGRF